MGVGSRVRILEGTLLGVQRLWGLFWKRFGVFVEEVVGICFWVGFGRILVG